MITLKKCTEHLGSIRERITQWVEQNHPHIAKRIPFLSRGGRQEIYSGGAEMLMTIYESVDTACQKANPPSKELLGLQRNAAETLVNYCLTGAQACVENKDYPSAGTFLFHGLAIADRFDYRVENYWRLIETVGNQFQHQDIEEGNMIGDESWTTNFWQNLYDITCENNEMRPPGRLLSRVVDIVAQNSDFN